MINFDRSTLPTLKCNLYKVPKCHNFRNVKNYTNKHLLSSLDSWHALSLAKCRTRCYLHSREIILATDERKFHFIGFWLALWPMQYRHIKDAYRRFCHSYEMSLLIPNWKIYVYYCFYAATITFSTSIEL